MSFNEVERVTADLNQIAGSFEDIIYADAPVGMIAPFGGDAAPTGWLLCDGSAVSRTTYSDLYAVIGTKYGAGDGSATFNLPDAEAGAALYPVGNADGLAKSSYIIKAVKTSLPTDFQEALDEKADLSLCIDKSISLVSADGVKTWAQLIAELFSTVPLTPASFIDATYVTINNMVFDYKGSGEYAHISTLNTGMVNIAFQFILASGKYYSANNTLSVSDISDQVPTGVVLQVWKRGGSYTS